MTENFNQVVWFPWMELEPMKCATKSKFKILPRTTDGNVIFNFYKKNCISCIKNLKSIEGIQNWRKLKCQCRFLFQGQIRPWLISMEKVSKFWSLISVFVYSAEAKNSLTLRKIRKIRKKNHAFKSRKSYWRIGKKRNWV